MTVPLLMLTRLEQGVVFYHENDELIFLEWLSRIPCVECCDGDGRYGLIARLKRRPGKDDLRQLLAVFRRYGVDMRQLAKFETAKNRAWFCDPKMYWHKAVFGKQRRAARRLRS